MYKFLILIISAVVLFGCQPMTETGESVKRNYYEPLRKSIVGPFRSDKHEIADESLGLTREEMKKVLTPYNNPAVIRPSSPSIPDISPILASPTPQDIDQHKLLSLSVTEDVPIKDVLLEIARMADVDLQLDPGIEGGIILRVKDRPLPEVVDRIADLAGLRYHFDNGILRVENDTPYLENYNVDFLNIVRSNQGSMQVNTQVLGGSSEGSGGGSITSGSASSITANYDGDLWQSVEAGLQDIVNRHTFKRSTSNREAPSGKTRESTDGGYVSVNRQAGVIALFTTQAKHRDVRKYLNRVKQAVSAQVLIEAKIVEVNLDEEFRTGIDWDFMDNHLKLFGTGSLVDSLAGATDTVKFGVLSKGGDIDAALTLTERFGVSRTLSSPRLHAMNNQQAILTFAENQVYFTLDVQEEEDEDSGGGTDRTLTIESTINTVPIGVILTLQPSVNVENNEITMNIRPTLSRITEKVSDPGTAIIAQRNNVSGISSEIPVVEVRELDSVMKIQSGQVMVIGGLMEERVNNSDRSVPYASKVPILGNIFKATSQVNEVVETVIFIKATVVPTRGVASADRQFYRTFTRDPRPLAF